MKPVPDISPVQRTRYVAAICLALAIPFQFVAIPPLSDIPGHMASAAVAAYAGTDPAFARFMGYHWYPIPNLGADLIVAGLRRAIGIPRAYWLVAAIIPPLLALGICMVARALNPRGAAAIGWALLFVYSYPLNYGFANYMLGVAFALIGLACWVGLDRRPRLREAATWMLMPLLFVCHVVAACLFALVVGSRELVAWRQRAGTLGDLVWRVRPLASLAVMILLWRLSAHSFAGRNRFGLKDKLNALVMILRDQNFALDIGSLVAAIIIFVIGWRKGARPSPALMPAILALMLLFCIIPSSLSGSDFADMRLLPLIPMLGFATQDWSGVEVRLVRIVAISGMLLLAIRLCFTIAGFVGYDARYAAELAALDHVADHSRIIVVNGHNCDARHNWRQSRLGHLGDLAILFRRSWTNSQWDIDGGQLLQVRYRPSPIFYHDPSQYVWPAQCGGRAAGRPTIGEALSAIPFGGIDYLWLIDAPLPPGYRDPRLTLRWREGDSALYAITPG